MKYHWTFDTSGCGSNIEFSGFLCQPRFWGLLLFNTSAHKLIYGSRADNSMNLSPLIVMKSTRLWCTSALHFVWTCRLRACQSGKADQPCSWCSSIRLPRNLINLLIQRSCLFQASWSAALHAVCWWRALLPLNCLFDIGRKSWRRGPDYNAMN